MDTHLHEVVKEWAQINHVERLEIVFETMFIHFYHLYAKK